MATSSPAARASAMLTRILVGTVLVVGIAAGTTACSLLGRTMNQQLSTEGNLANQKKVAAQFIDDYPHPELESIKFTIEGWVDGSGTWNANVIITVGSREYQAILGTFTSSGEILPTVPSGSKPHLVTVIHSDGTSEALG